MEYRQLGRSGLNVSVFCLGSMTWGEQNTEAEGHAQLDMAFARGVNFIDAAEMYPIPPRAETQGRTEEIIGGWLKKRRQRDDVIIAGKVVGPVADNYYRDGEIRLDKANITTAVEASLRRLGTDYIDLYQVHWPERQTNFFGRLGYRPTPSGDTTTPIAETLGVLDDLVGAGKIRHVGLSNETPWGLSRYLAAAAAMPAARPVSIQNPYNLLNRSFEVGLAEFADREQVGLLAYSPLAMGVLSGKYLDGARPPAARISRWPERYSRYTKEAVEPIVAAYVALAAEQGLAPAALALAFVRQQPFVTALISGATSMAQLGENLASLDLTLGDDVLAAIEAIHDRHPYPCP